LLHGEAAEYRVKRYTWSVTHLSKCPPKKNKHGSRISMLLLVRDREGTQDISGDQVENTAPSSSANCSRSISPLRVRNSAKVATGRHYVRVALFIKFSLFPIRVVVSRWGIRRRRFLVSLGKSVLNDALEALWPCGSDISFVGNFLFGTSYGGIVDVLFECDTRVVDIMEKLCFNRLIVPNHGMGWIARVAPLKGESCWSCHLGRELGVGIAVYYQ
jgi:hypothetical protein